MPSKKRQQYIIGVDLGGTNIVVGAMSADGRQHYAMWLPAMLSGK